MGWMTETNRQYKQATATDVVVRVGTKLTNKAIPNMTTSIYNASKGGKLKAGLGSFIEESRGNIGGILKGEAKSKAISFATQAPVKLINLASGKSNFNEPRSTVQTPEGRYGHIRGTTALFRQKELKPLTWASKSGSKAGRNA